VRRVTSHSVKALILGYRTIASLLAANSSNHKARPWASETCAAGARSALSASGRGLCERSWQSNPAIFSSFAKIDEVEIVAGVIGPHAVRLSALAFG